MEDHIGTLASKRTQRRRHLDLCELISLRGSCPCETCQGWRLDLRLRASIRAYCNGFEVWKIGTVRSNWADGSETAPYERYREKNQGKRENENMLEGTKEI